MTTIDDQRRAAETGALIHPRPELAALIVTGKDRQTWLNGLTTNNLANRKVGDGIFSLAVGKTGKILAELWLLLSAEHAVVGLLADRAEMLREHFDRHLIMEDVEVALAEGRSFLAVHGPLAGELVGFAREQGADAALLSFTGRPDSAVILAPAGQADALKSALLSRAGDRGALATPEGWEALRIAWGVPRVGVDHDDQSLPQEASLERLAVCFSKGCYLGQEAVFMLEKRGHAKKRLMRLAIEGDEAPPKGAVIALPDGTAVGEITSAVTGPDGKTLGLGHVKYKHAEADTAVTIAGRPGTVLGLAGEPAPPLTAG